MATKTLKKDYGTSIRISTHAYKQLTKIAKVRGLTIDEAIQLILIKLGKLS